MTAWTTSDGTGVRNRGCTPASQRGSTPSRAIAYGTRAAVSTMPLFAPSVATMIATATSPAPARPSVTWAASDATSDEAAIFAGDRTYVNEAVTRQYSAIPITVERTIERGRLRSGSFTSPPTYVISIQPSYAHSAATIATPNGASRLPNEPSGHRGRDRKSTRLNSSHTVISYAVFCLKKKKNIERKHKKKQKQRTNPNKQS